MSQSLNRQVIAGNAKAAEDAALPTRVLPAPVPVGNMFQDNKFMAEDLGYDEERLADAKMDIRHLKVQVKEQDKP